MHVIRRQLRFPVLRRADVPVDVILIDLVHHDLHRLWQAGLVQPDRLVEDHFSLPQFVVVHQHHQVVALVLGVGLAQGDANGTLALEAFCFPKIEPAPPAPRASCQSSRSVPRESSPACPRNRSSRRRSGPGPPSIASADRPASFATAGCGGLALKRRWPKRVSLRSARCRPALRQVLLA